MGGTSAFHHLPPLRHVAGVHCARKPTDRYRVGKLPVRSRPVADIRLEWHKPVMAVLLIIGFVVFLLNLRWGVVGIHGGGVERSANPPLYWAAMTMMAVCLMTLAFIVFTGR